MTVAPLARLSRHFDPRGGLLTPRVVTLWYRAPELLLGAERYGPEVDCWAAGCIIGELLGGAPLFPGQGEGDTVQLIFALLGAPSERIWPGWSRLPRAVAASAAAQPLNYLRQHFPKLRDEGVALLNHLLTYDPRRRLGAQEALGHAYFRTPPLPKPLEAMPTFPSTHLAGDAERDEEEPAGAAGEAGAADSRRKQPRREGVASLAQAQLREERFGAAFATAR